MTYFVALFLGTLAILAFAPTQRLAFLCVGAWLFPFAALRFNAGYDYLSYFLDIVEGGGRLARYELISRAVMEFASVTHPQWFFVITSAVFIGSTTAVLVRVQDRAAISRLAMLAFVALPIGFLDSLNFVRQMCAVALLALALVNRDKPAVMVASVLAAIGFHLTAVVFIPVAAVSLTVQRSAPQFVYVILLGVAFLCGQGIELISDITGFYAHYFAHFQSTMGLRTTLLLVAILAVSLLDLQRISEQKLLPEFHYFFVGVCLCVALAPYGTHIARIGWYGAAMYPIFVGLRLARADLVTKLIAATVMATVFLGLLYLASKHARWDGLNNYRVAPLLSYEYMFSTLETFRSVHGK